VFSRSWTKRKALCAPSDRVEARSTPNDADRRSSFTALTRHRLGVIAQTLEHWEAAIRCYAEALRVGVDLNEHMLCAQSCHQLSELRKAQDRLDEAIAWSILAFAMLEMAPERRGGEDLSDLADLADRVSLETCQDAWLCVTGEDLPIELRQSVQRLLERAVRALA
jgi:hypothetical protein